VLARSPLGTRYGPTFVWDGRELLELGGSAGGRLRGKPQLEVASFDPATDTWASLQPPISRQHPPLAMAMVAAAADAGTVRSPRLVVGESGAGAAAGTLPSALVKDLHEMMASVVASGTAAGQGLPAGTYAKTGTAQYGTSKPLKTDAWLVGFKGDIAFAALVVNSDGNGGPTCGPIVARFLNGLP